MAKYEFVTHWEFDAPVEKIWKKIYDMDEWPSWWKYVKSVTVIKHGGVDEIGTVRRIVWTTALPYELSFDSELVAVDPLKRIEGKAFGELTGSGIWTFETDGVKTRVRYDWVVITTKKWMNALAPIARPIFRWNHDMVMKAGYKGLRRVL